MMKPARSYYRLFSSIFIVLIMTLFTPTPPLPQYEAVESSSSSSLTRSLETGIHAISRSSYGARDSALTLQSKPLPKPDMKATAGMALLMAASLFLCKTAFSMRIERKLTFLKLLPILKGSMAPSCS